MLQTAKIPLCPDVSGDEVLSTLTAGKQYHNK